ncbi:undecaprenyl-phosphate alpha-N-acetylglucosaminyl 1-phosphate transferase [Pseudoalteromonas sp. BMB]|uniref:UDP-N-acetylglucosamine--undecaprenyl-phosphate N-acetylglucosaminephosphotransferase n=1 Tax=Pseudoalteromonas sp. BMB TaxID=1874619 RepID=UPI00083D837E|nr:UDP-N-acetylglucosamine--undecaprenyl-phosphate N-acetylglucosaminephosphotransferase [Pseudoalteromonas sp. BMB]ODB36777.1 undecaprenyl-phosphate alpha-N-acetylglucosaminyl 1-phosphate transferase [Pseudoalteromonas sp. BMB]
MGLEYLVIVCAVALSYLSIFATTPIALKFGLVDLPTKRKKHQGAIPLIGGIAISFASAACILLFLPISSSITAYLISALVIVVLGVVDDYKDLDAKFRLLIQTVVALTMMYGSGVYIENLGNLFTVGELNLGWGGIAFTVVAVIACINAFNMIDGIDGLAGSLSIVTFSSIFILMWLNGNQDLQYVPLILVSSLVPYLAFNVGIIGHNRRKIFMGDAGSMFIGLSVIWFLMMGSQKTEQDFRPVTALWIIAVPLMDMVAIIYRRLRKGQSPLTADRDHLHHIFLRFGLNARQSLYVIVTFSVVMSTLGIIGETFAVPESLMLAGFFGIFLGYTWCLQHCWRIARTVRKLRVGYLRNKRNKF